ncbi:hypothetical protein LCGC14_0434510 [marine sediment metagenome]|uniref:Uncharacterized protein n=1 Tax=marine sediment metagenome TaxID=412755 RepID=A0A0F9V973_9ZZZZ
MMKKLLSIIVLLNILILVLGSRGRYAPVFWKQVSGGIAYDQGSILAGAGFNYAIDTASNDTYLAAVPGITAYNTGLLIFLNPVTDNTTACTLNINSLGAKNIKDGLGGDPPTAHIDAAGITLLCYDGTNFVIINGDNNP